MRGALARRRLRGSWHGSTRARGRALVADQPRRPRAAPCSRFASRRPVPSPAFRTRAASSARRASTRHRCPATGLTRSASARRPRLEDDASVVDPAALASLASRASAYVSRALPGLDPDPAGQLHCWVTELPWSADGLAVWEHERILFVAGHNLFKQAPELGRLVARAALGDGLDERLRPESELGEP